MLIEYRNRLKLSRRKLAEEVEVDERTIFRIEHDTSIPLVDTYAKIVKALGMSEKEIYNELMKLVNEETISSK